MHFDKKLCDQFVGITSRSLGTKNFDPSKYLKAMVSAIGLRQKELLKETPRKTLAAIGDPPKPIGPPIMKEIIENCASGDPYGIVKNRVEEFQQEKSESPAEMQKTLFIHPQVQDKPLSPAPVAN